MATNKTTTFTVSITITGDPHDALARLQDCLNHAEPVLLYTTQTYTDENGEEVDTEELMR